MLAGFAGGLALAIGATVAGAEQKGPFGGFKHDSNAPIEIAADSLEVRQAENLAIFSGAVDAAQGTLRLTADKVTVNYGGGEGENGRIDRLRAEGKVFLSNGAETAAGQWADYDVAGGSVSMGGGVTLTQGDNAISGQTLSIDLNAGRGQISGGRVRSVFKPKTAGNQ